MAANIFYRWVPSQFAANAVNKGLLSHNGSALWIFSLDKSYRPGNGITTGACLIAYDLDQTATQNVTTIGLVDFEGDADTWKGENGHPWQIIVKKNEQGAYGVGRLRQGATKTHTRTRYASKKEVAKALDLNEMEDGVTSRKPPGLTSWP